MRQWLHSVVTSGRLVELNLPTFTVSARMGDVPTRVRLQHADGRTSEMWLENDIVDLGRILINGKWFQAVDDNPDDATPTYKEEPTSED